MFQHYGGLHVPHKIFSLFYKREELRKYFSMIVQAICLFSMVTHAIGLFSVIEHTVCLFSTIAHPICLFSTIVHAIYLFVVIAQIIWLFTVIALASCLFSMITHVAFCRLNWSLVCVQTLFCFIIVLFTLGNFTIWLFMFDKKRFFIEKEDEGVNSQRFQGKLRVFSVFFIVKVFSSKYSSFVSNFIHLQRFYLPVSWLHTIVSLFIFTFHTCGINYIGMFDQVYCPYFEIFH